MLIALLMVHSAPALAGSLPGVGDADRARTHYMLHCQGCHRADGSGSTDAGVPPMKDFVGNFLKVPGGREFLVQVPGSANAALTDSQLTELLNWLLPTMSPEQMPSGFRPYEVQEVSTLRRTPLLDVNRRREALIEAMRASRALPD